MYLAMSGWRRERVTSVLLRTSIALVAVAIFALWIGPVSAFDTWWVQAHQETQLWSGPDSRAVAFGTVAQWSYLQVVLPQQGSRLYVFNPVTENYAYVDAAAVGPSGPPPSAPRTGIVTASGSGGGGLRKIPVIAGDYQPWWVANFKETELWAGPDEGAKSLGKVPQFRRFLVVEPQKGDWLRVWSPEKDEYGYLDAGIVGPTGPSVWLQAKAP